LVEIEANKATTIQVLGEGKAYHITSVHVSALLGLREAVKASYAPEELAKSLLFAQTASILVELSWAQLALLSANYPAAFRCLRSALELACRARLVDLAYPSEALGRKLVKAALLEKRRKLPKGWKLVKKAFEALQGFELERDERLRLRRAWKAMNRYVHPSSTAGEGQEGWRPYSFSEHLALAALGASDVVSDAILLLILDAFPRAHERASAFLSAREWEDYLPMAYRYIRARTR